jgi:hypothetical protein
MIIPIIFWILVSLVGIILLVSNAAIAGFLHQSYFFKVSRSSFVKDLEKIIYGSITYPEYDSLTSVTIVQDKLLCKCQEEIVDMEENYSKGAKEGFYFNENGNRKISEMITMLKTTKEAIVPERKEIARAWRTFIIILLVDAFVIVGIVWVKRALHL